MSALTGIEAFASAPFLPPGPRGLEAGLGPLPNEGAFELCEGSEDVEDVPHGHPAHRHGGGPSSVPTADARGGHEPLRELVAQLIELLVPFAQAQVQPPPLTVYDTDMTGPSSTAPTTSRTDLEVVLDVDIPLVDTVRDLIVRLDQAITAHVAARPGHAHSHPHTH